LSLQPTTRDGVLIWMQVERAPMLGIALAVLVLVVEGVGLVALRDARLERVDAAVVTQRMFEPEVALLRERLALLDVELERVRDERGRRGGRTERCGSVAVDISREERDLLALHRQLMVELLDLRLAALRAEK
jgi:hypothetical protein